MNLRPFLFALLLASCAPKPTFYYEVRPPLTSIHLIDREGMTEAIANTERLKNFQDVDFLSHQPYQKVLRVFERDCKGDVLAYITTYHPNGQIRQYLEILNNRAFGTYREWYANGTLKVEAKIVEGTADISVAAEKSWLFDGCTKAFNECGELEATFNYCRGSLEGLAVYYHASGAIWKEVPYKNNLISGESKIYLESGEILQTTDYKNGLKWGRSIRFWPDLTISSREEYIQGRLMNACYTSLDGAIVAEIINGEGYRAVFGRETISELHEVHSGVPLGEVKIYTKSGNLSKIYHVKNDLKHGEELFFYPAMNGDPSPKLSIYWYEGKIQGLVKTWYDNQGMESQREMSGNTRNGVSTAWYRDGQLMMIEEYESDKLKKGDYYRKGYKQPLSQVINGEGTVTLFDSEGNYLRKIPYVNGRPDS